MRDGEQRVQVARDSTTHEATVAWRYDQGRWAVSLRGDAFDVDEQWADDAFEALCLVRGRLEPLGWRVGVVGAQADVWPSGMARDQGGGLRAYRMTEQGVGDLVDVFEPVDPSTVTTVEAQRAEADRLYEAIRSGVRTAPDSARPSSAAAGRGSWLGRRLRRRRA